MQHASYEERGTDRVYAEGTVKLTVKEVKGEGNSWVPMLTIYNMNGQMLSEMEISQVSLSLLGMERSIAVHPEEEEDQEEEGQSAGEQMQAYNRIRQIMSDANSKPGDLGKTLVMLKHMQQLPRHLQKQLQNPNIPIHNVINGMNHHLTVYPEEGQKMAPLQYDLNEVNQRLKNRLAAGRNSSPTEEQTTSEVPQE